MYIPKTKEVISMTEKIKEQILAIRDTGKTNMLDTNYVQRLAFESHYYELVNFIPDDRTASVQSTLYVD